MKKWCGALVFTVLAAAATAGPPVVVVDALRGAVPIPENTRPPRMGNAVNDDLRRTRNYDMQPPIIPHRVDGYQVDKNFNRCLDCHAREKTEFSQAIPVSATHYMDRDGRVLGRVSTRRYFCQQCHVAQDAVQPLVRSTFADVDTVMRQEAAASAAGGRPGGARR